VFSSDGIKSTAALPHGRLAYIPVTSNNSMFVQFVLENGTADTRSGGGGLLELATPDANYSYESGAVRYIGGGWLYVIGKRLPSSNVANAEIMIYKVSIN